MFFNLVYAGKPHLPESLSANVNCDSSHLKVTIKEEPVDVKPDINDLGFSKCPPESSLLTRTIVVSTFQRQYEQKCKKASGIALKTGCDKLLQAEKKAVERKEKRVNDSAREETERKRHKSDDLHITGKTATDRDVAKPGKGKHARSVTSESVTRVTCVGDRYSTKAGQAVPGHDENDNNEWLKIGFSDNTSAERDSDAHRAKKSKRDDRDVVAMEAESKTIEERKRHKSKDKKKKKHSRDKDRNPVKDKEKDVAVDNNKQKSRVENSEGDDGSKRKHKKMSSKDREKSKDRSGTHR